MTASLPRTGMLALALAAGALAGCYDPADPDMYPLRFETVRTMGQAQYFADLDGDGRDEVFSISDHAAQAGHPALYLRTLSGRVIEQTNMPASFRLPAFFRPHTLDLDGDGWLEVAVPLLRGDSLFVRVLDREGAYRRQYVLAAGEPRAVEGGVLAWDPDLYNLFMEDVDSDGVPELVAVVHTGYARAPRGVFILDVASGERLGAFLFGAAIGGPQVVMDIDGDGVREIVFVTAASDNGARAGGFSDDRSYAGVIDLGLRPRVRWSVVGDKNRFSGMQASPLPNVDGTRRILIAELAGASRPTPGRLRVYDAASGAVVRERSWPTGLGKVHVGAAEGSGLLYVHDLAGRMSVLTPELGVIADRYLDGIASRVLDIDGDGVEEVMVWHSARGYHLFVGPDLQVSAVVPGRWASIVPVQQGVGQPPLIAARTYGNDARTSLYRVEANPWWWLYRYGLDALVGLGIVLVLGLTAVGVRRVRSRQVGEAVHRRTLASDERGLLVLRPDGTVAETNPAFRHRLGLDGEVGPDLLRAVGERAPAFGAFLAALPESPAHRREGAVALGDDPAWVVAEPLDVERRGLPFWLVSVTSPPVVDGGGEAEGTWPLLARRVVHDLKNPLTSILLTLQRMQMEAHAHDPDVPAGDLAARLDPYVERVEGRVEHLRRMAHNLLKFLDAAQPELVEADLCTVVEHAVDTLRRALPADVRIDLRPCAAPLPVLADAEQIASALENLVMNAVQALPDGGVITVQGRVMRRVQPEGAPAPLDFAGVEVLDTGRGMDAAERQRAFDPGYTTRDGGTGLGLALVRKVVGDHGGFAEIESEPGTGTAVCLYVPLRDDAQQDDAISPRAEAGARPAELEEGAP